MQPPETQPTQLSTMSPAAQIRAATPQPEKMREWIATVAALLTACSSAGLLVASNGPMTTRPWPIVALAALVAATAWIFTICRTWLKGRGLSVLVPVMIALSVGAGCAGSSSGGTGMTGVAALLFLVASIALYTRGRAALFALLVMSLAPRAHADHVSPGAPRDASIHMRAVADDVVTPPPPAPAPSLTVSAPQPAAPPARDLAHEAAVVISGLQAGLQAGQAGLQAPVLKGWMDTKAGQILLGTIAGAIVITSAAGAAALVFETAPR